MSQKVPTKDGKSQYPTLKVVKLADEIARDPSMVSPRVDPSGPTTEAGWPYKLVLTIDGQSREYGLLGEDNIIKQERAARDGS